MALFSSSTDLERVLNELAQNRTSTSTASTQEIEPGPRSPYASALESLAARLDQMGGQYGDKLSGAIEDYRDTYSRGAFPQFDPTAMKSRTDAYATLLDETGRPMIERGRETFANRPSAGAVSKLDATALNPLDDDVESYFRDQFTKDRDSRLARLGLVGQGNGEALAADEMARYTMGRRDTADQRRILSANAAAGLRAGDLDLALRELTGGAQFLTGAKQARDATEQLVQDYAIQAHKGVVDDAYNHAARMAGLAGAEGAVRSMPASLYGTLYGLDQARLNTARKVNSAATADLTGSSSGSTNASGSSTTNPSAIDALSATLKLIPTAAQVGTAVAPAVGKGVDALSSLLSSSAPTYDTASLLAQSYGYF